MCQKCDKWDHRNMDQAKMYASWSKDKNTGVGAIIVDSFNTLIAQGYNGFPRFADDSVEERYEKPLKYLWTEHAERNAIYNAARIGRSVDGCFIYVTYFPCVDCTRAIIQSGIAGVVAPKPDFDHAKWGESWTIAMEMLRECNVHVKFYEDEQD